MVLPTASALPHSFCFLGMIISCWHYESVFWGKRNVGTCYFWNECSMHPIEVNYSECKYWPTWSYLIQSFTALMLFLPGNVNSSYYLLPSADLHRKQTFFRESMSSNFPKSWKLLSSGSQSQLFIWITLGFLKEKGKQNKANKKTVPGPYPREGLIESLRLGPPKALVFFQSSPKCF